MKGLKNKEIERKFLVKKVPKNYDGHPRKTVNQGYRGSLRLRAEFDPSTTSWSYFITIKTGSGKVREQFEDRISVSQFNNLWPAVEKKIIKKVRYFLPFRNETIELDLFFGNLEGRMLVEVEFDSIEECDAFVPPKWFGREVTEDKRYTNHSLAMYGWPED